MFHVSGHSAYDLIIEEAHETGRLKGTMTIPAHDRDEADVSGRIRPDLAGDEGDARSVGYEMEILHNDMTAGIECATWSSTLLLFGVCVVVCKSRKVGRLGSERKIAENGTDIRLMLSPRGLYTGFLQYKCPLRG